MCGDTLSQKVQCYSLAVGHRRCDEAAFSQNVYCHSLAVGHQKRSDKTDFCKMCSVTHFLLVMGKDVIRLSWQNVQCHSQPISHMMRLPFTKCILLLTSCWSYETMWSDCLWPNGHYHSLAVSHRQQHDEIAFHTMCNVTHFLFVMWKRCDDTAFHKMHNVAYFLLVTGKRCDDTAFLLR